MSLVGTRPILPDELEQYELHHRARIAIKPGITGMWQVSGRSDITDFEEIVRLDTEWGHFCISKADACKAVSQTDIPILIIHGDRDTQAPLSMAYRLYDSCSSEKQLYSGLPCQR